MDFEAWKAKLAEALTEFFKMTPEEAADYIKETGDECWRESWDDGNSPREAAAEEAWAAMWSAP